MDECLVLERSEVFSLSRRGAILSMEVYSPPVAVLELLGTLNKYVDPKDVDLDRVREIAMSGGSGEIGRVKDLEDISGPSIRIMDGGARCLVSLPPGFDDLEMLESLLASKGVVHGIDLEEMKRLVSMSSEGDAVSDALIALGTPPSHGKDGWIEYMKERPSGAPRTDDSGQVDFYSLDLVVQAHKGDVLAVRHDPIPSEEGITVTGEPIPGKKVKGVRISFGKGIEMDGNSLVASVDGQVIWKGDRMSIEPLLVISGNLGPDTGNVDYDGPVLVKGDVQDGYNLRAGGDVEIQGCVERASVKSGGSVSVLYGIAGKGYGAVKADGNVWAKFVQEAEVHCSQLKVNEYILRSKIFAKSGVFVEGRNGVVMASRIEAAAYVNVRSVKIFKKDDTAISISGMSRVTLFDQYRKLQDESAEAKDEMIALSSMIRTLSQKGLYRKAKTHLSKFIDLEETQSLRTNKLHAFKETLMNLKGDATFSLIGNATGDVSVRLKNVPCRVENGARWMTMYYDPDSNEVRVVSRS